MLIWKISFQRGWELLEEQSWQFSVSQSLLGLNSSLSFSSVSLWFKVHLPTRLCLPFKCSSNILSKIESVRMTNQACPLENRGSCWVFMSLCCLVVLPDLWLRCPCPLSDQVLSEVHGWWNSGPSPSTQATFPGSSAISLLTSWGWAHETRSPHSAHLLDENRRLPACLLWDRRSVWCRLCSPFSTQRPPALHHTIWLCVAASTETAFSREEGHGFLLAQLLPPLLHIWTCYIIPPLSKG